MRTIAGTILCAAVSAAAFGQSTPSTTAQADAAAGSATPAKAEARARIKMHAEDLPEDAYTLVAVAPRMTKADPAERTQCKEGPGPDGNDPRLNHPMLNMLVTCQNVTMAQAAQLFPTFAAWYIHYPVLDSTNLKGGWDFTLSWSSGNFMMPAPGTPSSPDSQSEIAADPNGALSFYDAVNRELGLKLEKVKRPEPVMVIDHIDDQPTPN